MTIFSFQMFLRHTNAANLLTQYKHIVRPLSSSQLLEVLRFQSGKRLSFLHAADTAAPYFLYEQQNKSIKVFLVRFTL